MKVIAAILAGGSGKRFGGETPKQLLPLGGKPVIEHSIAAFERCEGIDGIVLVCREDMIPSLEEIVRRGGYRKVAAIVPGGADRSGSSLAAIRAASSLAGPDSQLLLHDAARPLVGEDVIGRCLEALDRFDAVEAAVPATDTIIRVDRDGFVTDIPARSELRYVQTPQGFSLKVIAEAYRRAGEDPAFMATDDVSVVRRYLPGVPVAVVEGSPRNLKLTHPSDLPVLEALFRN